VNADISEELRESLIIREEGPHVVAAICPCIFLLIVCYTGETGLNALRHNAAPRAECL